MAAGTAVITRKNSFDGVEMIYTWTSSAAGAVNGYYVPAHGYLFAVIMEPDSTDDPTDAYDVVINNGKSLDIWAGGGANMSNAAGMTLAEMYYSVLDPNGNYYWFFNDRIEPQITNAGDSKKGIIRFQFTRTNPGKM